MLVARAMHIGSNARELLDDQREFEMAVRDETIAALPRCLDMRRRPPLSKPRRCRLVEKEGVAKRRLYPLLHLRAHRIDDHAHALDAARQRLQRLDIIADRLFARDIRQRLEDRCEKARQLGRWLAAAQRHAAPPRLGVDIDKAPVHLAPRRALF